MHDWNTDELPGHAFAVNRAKGSAALKTAGSLSPLAGLSLTFAPTAHKKAACFGGGSEITYSGKLTGAVKLATGLKKLKLSKVRAHFARTTLEIDSLSCSPEPCTALSWSAFREDKGGPVGDVAGGVLVGRPGHQAVYSEVARSVHLAKPKDTYRSDGALMKTARPKFSASKKSLSVATSKSGIVTGSAVIGPAIALRPMSETCTADGRAYTGKVREYEGKFASPAATSSRHTRC